MAVNLARGGVVAAVAGVGRGLAAAVAAAAIYILVYVSTRTEVLRVGCLA
jgi:hypothetical protein